VTENHVLRKTINKYREHPPLRKSNFLKKIEAEFLLQKGAVNSSLSEYI
jgi:hypothetical protein